jgi:hypothetical protein
MSLATGKTIAIDPPISRANGEGADLVGLDMFIFAHALVRRFDVHNQALRSVEDILSYVMRSA